MNIKKLLFLSLLFALPALGQGMRYDNFVLKPTQSGGVTPVSGALITVCTSAGSGTPCTPKVANIYSDEALTAPLTGTGGAGTTNSDANGNFGFYALPGSYIVTVTGTGITSYTIKVMLPLGTAATNTFTNHNNIYWAGPGATPTIDQAKTACGALSGCIVNISPGYTGPEATSCVANSTGYFTDQSAANVVIHDYRALTPLGRCFYGFVVGGRSFGALTKLGSTGFWTGVLSDSVTAQSNINFVTGATLPSNGGAMNGAVSVVLSSDANTVGTSNAPWVGQDGECSIAATSFDYPVNNCYGSNGQANILRANTTQSIINGIGQHAAVNANVSASGAQMINSYGTYNEAQNVGVGRNYSEYNKGNVLFDTETQIHSLITGANVTITAATESGQIVTITTSGVCTFTTNQEVSISGVTPSAYNGRYFVRSPGCNGGSTFTFFHPSSASLGAGTVFGIVNGLTTQTTTYFRNTNSIEHKPLADNVGWTWLTQAGGGAFRIIPSLAIISSIPHEFAARQILDEITPPSGSATQSLVWADSGDHFLHFNPNNQGNQQVQQSLVITSQYTNSTTGFTTVTGLSWPVKASTTYTGECHLYYQAAATGGLNIQFTGPASPTTVIYGLNDPSAATTFNSAVATAFSTSLGQVVGTAATNFDAVVSFSLINGVNAGTVTLQAKSSAAVQLQIQAGSFCRIQ